MTPDPTGVRLLPEDSGGFIVYDQYATYQLGRMILRGMAKAYPDRLEEFRQCALWMNQRHLRSILRQAVYRKSPKAWEGLGKYCIENLPRAERRACQVAMNW